MPKKVNSTYIFSTYNSSYERSIFSFIMTAERIDTNDDDFEDIRYDISKRAITSNMVKALQSSKIVLGITDNPMPKTFKVFAANDVKEDKQLKIWIDVTNIITKKDGVYRCSNIDALICYIMNAMVTLTYNVMPSKILDNARLIEEGADAFSSIFSYIMDYIYKTNSIRDMKDKILYLSSMYYCVNILEKKFDSEQTHGVCKSIAGLSNAGALSITVDLKEDDFLNLKFFIEAMARILRLPKLSTEIIVEKWMYVFGTGTVLGLEMFPSFSAMITDAYIGSYLNNQKSIEKILGSKMVSYTKKIISIIEGV